MSMTHFVYCIKTITNSNYYSIKKTPITKVVYFNSYIDAQKYASFLSLHYNTFKQLHEYKKPNNIHIYHEYFEIEKHEKEFFNFQLSLNNLGFHECEVIDDLVHCMDTGIFDVHSDIKNIYINDTLSTILET
jgi:hypothetical protein